MSRTLRQWLLGSGAADEWAAVKHWCAAEGLSLKLTREHDGFVIEPALAGALPVRIEWGPSQRPYLGGMELRLRGETGIDPFSYGAVMPLAQMEELEQALFAQSTGGVQTRFDSNLPEEVRWLAMGERLDATQLGPLLREEVGAVGHVAAWMAQWLQGPTGPALKAWLQAEGLRRAAAASPEERHSSPAWALLALRGRLVWRQALAEPGVAALSGARQAFEVALREARAFAEGPVPTQSGPGSLSGVSGLPDPPSEL